MCGGVSMSRQGSCASGLSAAAWAGASLTHDGSSVGGGTAQLSLTISRHTHKGAFGVEMLRHLSPSGAPSYEATVEAATNCQLFRLQLSAWRTLCAAFPDELGPISRAQPDGDDDSGDDRSRGGSFEKGHRSRGDHHGGEGSGPASFRSIALLAGRAKEWRMRAMRNRDKLATATAEAAPQPPAE